ncbi:Bug family tripartite tricarboxylate transporter substrate binding protein [Halegenticoccus tardaugens]|uniref:Bug family tripartite tricarboxylate transporter substrate binding protein n=1 Tax=Halegenticoccus tardaugens TaxID=2071624 RepID=UPI00100B61E7|nr:tripartite tricarboxylate transporter substrate binding protein [Halegenticoccus tardaugens]
MRRQRDAFTRRQFVGAAAGTGLVGLAGCLDNLDELDSDEQQFPSEKIEMVCPWSAGGGTDRTGRKLAELGKERLETSLFVTNQTGGSGSVGFNAIANADPDGHTLGITTVEICTISHLDIAGVGPDDLAPVLQYNFDPAALTVPQDAPYGSLDEFVDYAKDNPNEINVSNSGTGAIWHLSAAGFAREAGIEVEHVGYDGGSPATKAVVNGEVDATAASAAEVASQVTDGPLTVLGVMGDDRVDIFPEVPTFKELGYDFEMGAWRGLTVPKDTPQERIEALHGAFKSVYDSDDFRSFMEENGFGLVYRNTKEFGEFMDAEFDRFGKIVDQLDLSA